MLKYDYQVEGDPQDPQDNALPISGKLNNPFPGLRPFDIDECHLFFGRERHVDEILYKLAEHKFVTVLGYSGSGKSSLMYCGVIPVLIGGFMTNVGANWKVINARPGNNPISNLAGSVIKGTREISDEYSTEFQLKKTIVSAVLNSGSDGLVRAIKQFKLQSDENHKSPRSDRDVHDYCTSIDFRLSFSYHFYVLLAVIEALITSHFSIIQKKLYFHSSFQN